MTTPTDPYLTSDPIELRRMLVAATQRADTAERTLASANAKLEAATAQIGTLTEHRIRAILRREIDAADPYSPQSAVQIVDDILRRATDLRAVQLPSGVDDLTGTIDGAEFHAAGPIVARYMAEHPWFTRAHHDAAHAREVAIERGEARDDMSEAELLAMDARTHRATAATQPPRRALRPVPSRPDLADRDPDSLSADDLLALDAAQRAGGEAA